LSQESKIPVDRRPSHSFFPALLFELLYSGSREMIQLRIFSKECYEVDGERPYSPDEIAPGSRETDAASVDSGSSGGRCRRDG